jgi:hypothetical protein
VLLQGYKAAGQYQAALANIKWVTDYFIKCIGDGKEIVVQVRERLESISEPNLSGFAARCKFNFD